jgi:hypothetical protein
MRSTVSSDGIVGSYPLARAPDPGQFTVCLASHGIKLPDSGALTACIQGVHDLPALQACLTKGAR